MPSSEKGRKEYNEALELEALQRVFDRLDKKGDKKVPFAGRPRAQLAC
jgi:hypothetical protein